MELLIGEVHITYYFFVTLTETSQASLRFNEDIV